MSYPILVERLASDQALRIVCYEGCKWEATIKPEDIRNEQDYGCPQCRGHAGYKYEEADHKCPNCGKLGFFPDACKPCCSRVCKLQNEWAQELAARRTAASPAPVGQILLGSGGAGHSTAPMNCNISSGDSETMYRDVTPRLL